MVKPASLNRNRLETAKACIKKVLATPRLPISTTLELQFIQGLVEEQQIRIDEIERTEYDRENKTTKGRATSTPQQANTPAKT